MKKKLRFGIDSGASTNNASPSDALPPPVTHKELEQAGQQRLRFRPFSIEQERNAVDWWARRLLHAEASTGNTAASKAPDKYMQGVRSRLTQNEDVLFGVVEEWRKAKATFTLDEPIWTEPSPATKLRFISRPRPAAVAALA